MELINRVLSYKYFEMDYNDASKKLDNGVRKHSPRKKSFLKG